MKTHYLDKYLMNPTHEISVNLIGCGGTGSKILSGLASMHIALTELGKVGLNVYVYDGDVVTKSNIGRQVYSPSDVGYYKSDVMVTRINRFYGLEWKSETVNYDKNLIHSTTYVDRLKANITIIAVDNIEARKQINKFLLKEEPCNEQFKPLYIIDTGNSRFDGQVVAYTACIISQPDMGDENNDAVWTLKSPFELYNMVEQPNEPSCSVIESLRTQDLYINNTIADFAMHWLWSLLRRTFTYDQGIFLNLEKNTVIPIML